MSELAPEHDPVTEDTLLGGRVRLRQPRRGLRAGLDAVLLAATVPARPGQRVLEAGCGSGAAFLCLAARVPDLRVVAVELDPVLAALARENAARNGLGDRVTVIEGDVRDKTLRHALPPCDHAFANPPYWPAGTPPPEPRRRAMVYEGGATLGDWAGCLVSGLAGRGSVTLVLPAGRFDAGAAALREAGCGSTILLPLWPRAGDKAKRVLLRSRRDGRGEASLLPGLVLHQADGSWTGEAAAVLAEAAALRLD